MKRGAEPPDPFEPPKLLKNPKQQSLGSFFKRASTTEKAGQDEANQKRLDADLENLRTDAAARQQAAVEARAAARAAQNCARTCAADSRAKQHRDFKNPTTTKWQHSGMLVMCQEYSWCHF
jgi:hypothetical protein